MAPPTAEQGVETRLVLKLYIAGEAPNSSAATTNLRGALAQFPSLMFDLEIVDVLRTPERALRDFVVITPMLVKLSPHPERRVLGNLRNMTLLLGALGLDQEPRV